jgi:hypothetical protein
MTDSDQQANSRTGDPESEPRRSRLSRILAERPEARPRLRHAVSSLIATALVAFAAMGILLIWHFRRRAQLIRDRLSPPRKVSLPDLATTPDDEQTQPPGSVAADSGSV